jgi:2-keto-4-pentenoate hydratase/2-oxohepta-3-ene-1,7-dioic acid hydratase in catechol pathway
MKFVRYDHKGEVKFGILEEKLIYELSGDIFTSYSKTGHILSLEDVNLLYPLQPGKIIGLSNVNYFSRMKKLTLPYPDQILFFVKPANTLNHPDQPIEIPSYVNKAAHELELTIVVGKKGKYISREEAEDYIFGYTLANDITFRDFMVPGMPVGKAKSFDTLTPLGPCVETEVDLQTLHYRMYVSGELRHDVYANDLIYDPAQIISELSQFMTLEVGDIIMTGAPCNNIEFQVGDTIEIQCEQIGSMVNPVVASFR